MIRVRHRFKISVSFFVFSILLVSFLSCERSKGQLPTKQERVYLFNWSDYITQSVLDRFENETGIKVIQDYFGSNEEMISKLQSGAFQYDVVVPSDYAIRVLMKRKMLLPLNRKKLPHLENLMPRFKNPEYDPGNRYSVPYFWGTTGIAYHSRHVQPPPDSWNAFTDPRWRGKANLLDDPREVVGVALLINGYGMNEIEPDALEKAKPTLFEQKSVLRTYNATSYREILDAEDVWITQAYSGDILQLARSNPNIDYVIPKEGAALYVDNLAIYKGARNVENAHRLINFVLKKEIATELARNLLFATPNLEAWKNLPKKIQEDRRIYPEQETWNRLYYFKDISAREARLLEDVWIELKTF